MNQVMWNSLNPRQRDTFRADNPQLQNLTPQLIGLEHCYIEATDPYGDTRRFWVGLSTGWGQIHLELRTARSHGGDPAEASYRNVKVLKRKY
jgi:hypothetical protein